MVTGRKVEVEMKYQLKAPDSADSYLVAPELAKFSGAEGEEEPAWGASRGEWDVPREPWTEFDLPDLLRASDAATAADDADSESSMRRDSRSNGEGRPS